MNINLIMTVAPLIVSAICFGAGLYLIIKQRGAIESLPSALVPFAVGMTLLLSVLVKL